MNITNSTIRNDFFMQYDVTDRIREFGSKHFGVTEADIAFDKKLKEAATRLFWDHYFDSGVEL
jgi:hypothetical protein